MYVQCTYCPLIWRKKRAYTELCAVNFRKLVIAHSIFLSNYYCIEIWRESPKLEHASEDFLNSDDHSFTYFNNLFLINMPSKLQCHACTGTNSWNCQLLLSNTYEFITISFNLARIILQKNNNNDVLTNASLSIFLYVIKHFQIRTCCGKTYYT
jgi:hypothetical protein